MKISLYPSTQASVSERSKLHHRTAAAGAHSSKRTKELERFDTTSAHVTTEGEVNSKKKAHPPRTTSPPKATQESLDVRARQNLAREEDILTLNNVARTAGIAPPPPPQTFPTSSLICYEDNALRGLLRFSDEARVLCPLYLGSGQVNQAGLAAIAGQYPPPEVSSACSCFESRLSTGCCTSTATTRRRSLQDLVGSSLHSTNSADAVGLGSTTPIPSAATEDATFAHPTEYYGPPPVASTVTVTGEWLGPTSILSISISSIPSETAPSTHAPGTVSPLSTTGTSAAQAAAVVGDAKVWLGGGDVLAPTVVAVVVNYSHPHAIQHR
ncbi:MAG: hypothetical protein Q9168_005116 [Polycauliona sp. 1 TL-2023]